MRRMILLSILFLLPILIIHAQESTEKSDTTWDIIERCVGEPTTPPDDWIFEGTILATGWAGIHGINANWDVPHVQVFYDNWALFRELSLDDKWFVTTTATEEPCPNCFSHTWNITELRVISTLDAEEFIISTNASYEYGLGYQTRIQMRWWDDDIVFFTDGYSIYGRDSIQERIDPFSGDVDTIELPINVLTNDFDFHPAPNWEIAVYNPIQLPDKGEWGLYDLNSGEHLIDIPSLSGGAFLTNELVWSHDSTKFVAITKIEDTKYLTLYDHSTGQLSSIYQLPESVSPHHIEWSFDNKYIALIRSINSFLDDVLIIDIENQVIIETCIQSATLHWSPTSSQLALLSNMGQSPVFIRRKKPLPQVVEEAEVRP